LKRAKIVGSSAYEGATTTRVENYIREALEPFLERRIASAFDIVVTRADRDRIDALVRIYRGPVRPIELRYQVLWEDIERDYGLLPPPDIGTPQQP
jgi:hypothetical protein